jgi:HEAT repeat protein
MNGIRQELLHLLVLNYAEKWVPNHIALEQLEHYGDGLIPALIDCLYDYDSEVRQLAINLLDEGGLRAGPALPALIQSVTDPDRLVRVAAAHCLQKFGPKAVEAVPLLLPWLQDDHEFVRLLAAVVILKLDPTKRDELMPIVRSARGSENPMVQGMAEEFIAGK